MSFSHRFSTSADTVQQADNASHERHTQSVPDYNSAVTVWHRNQKWRSQDDIQALDPWFMIKNYCSFATSARKSNMLTEGDSAETLDASEVSKTGGSLLDPPPPWEQENHQELCKTAANRFKFIFIPANLEKQLDAVRCYKVLDS